MFFGCTMFTIFNYDFAFGFDFLECFIYIWHYNILMNFCVSDYLVIVSYLVLIDLYG